MLFRPKARRPYNKRTNNHNIKELHKNINNTKTCNSRMCKASIRMGLKKATLHCVKLALEKLEAL
jgi:hypothetical protein